jgi:hypothetical protein
MKNKYGLIFRSLIIFLLGLPMFFMMVYLTVIITALVHYGNVNFDVLLSTKILLASLKQAALMASISIILYIVFQWSK